MNLARPSVLQVAALLILGLEDLWQAVGVMGSQPFPSPELIPDVGCGRPTIQAPAPDTLTNGQWRMYVEVSEDDGLVLRDIYLGDRYMAARISLPYYKLLLDDFPVAFAELKANSIDRKARSRLIDFVRSPGSQLVIEATYEIDKIPEGANRCLRVTQRYEFHNPLLGDNCEPTGEVNCARFFPIAKYQFLGEFGERLKIQLPQRFHFQVDRMQANMAAVFEDKDRLAFKPCSIISMSRNPLASEAIFGVLLSGRKAQSGGDTWDNFHQTSHRNVSPPTACPPKAGCPECLHIHWRWSKAIPDRFPDFKDHNGGLPRIPSVSNQDVTIGVLKHKDLIIEEDPLVGGGRVDWRSFVEPESLVGGSPPQFSTGLVFWYEGTGYQASDAFFSHGGFFSPTAGSRVR